MEILTIVIVILASISSALMMHIYDRNKDGTITKQEIIETIKELMNKK